MHRRSCINGLIFGEKQLHETTTYLSHYHGPSMHILSAPGHCVMKVLTEGGGRFSLEALMGRFMAKFLPAKALRVQLTLRYRSRVNIVPASHFVDVHEN